MNREIVKTSRNGGGARARICVMVVAGDPDVRDRLAALPREDEAFRVGAAAASCAEAMQCLRATRPDMVLLDDVLAGEDALGFCIDLKRFASTTSVVLRTGFVDDVAVALARIAAADGVVARSASLEVVASTLRAVADRGSAMPEVSPEAVAVIGADLDPDDRRIVRRLVDGASPAEIADLMGAPVRDVLSWQRKVLDRMRRRKHGSG